MPLPSRSPSIIACEVTMSQMMPRRLLGLMALAALLWTATARAQQSPFNWHDDYTEYNLLDPASHQFHIVYYLNQRRSGATTVLNQTRSGSEGSDISVVDPRTGQPLKFDYRTGKELAAEGEAGRLAPAEHYIRAFLSQPVPEGGEGRVRIEKTYLDERSYSMDGEEIVFARSLGIGRNAVVLPRGYDLASSNVAGQVMATADGRIKVSFENVNGYAADVNIRGVKVPGARAEGLPVVEHAADFSKTLYDLGDAAGHEIHVQHQYIETTVGPRAVPAFLTRHALIDLRAVDMDTGRMIVPMQEGTRVALSLATPIGRGIETTQVKLTGVERDPAYRLDGGHLVWETTLHERAVIVLPAGWHLISLSAPGIVSTGSDGRVVIRVANPRAEPVSLALKAALR